MIEIADNNKATYASPGAELSFVLKKAHHCLSRILRRIDRRLPHTCAHTIEPYQAL